MVTNQLCESYLDNQIKGWRMLASLIMKYQSRALRIALLELSQRNKQWEQQQRIQWMIVIETLGIEEAARYLIIPKGMRM